MSLILILFFICLILLVFFFLFIYTAHKDYLDRKNKDDYKPELFNKLGEIKYSTRPINSEKNLDDIQLSLVFPAYNEVKRLPPALAKTIKYFENLKETEKLSYEIIVVNDGSKDNTLQMIKEEMQKYPNVLITGVTYKKNAGKGYAVKTGMTFAKGKYILMLDSDGATDIRDYKTLMEKVENKPMCLAIGSRHIVTENVQRDWWRSMFGHINNFVVKSMIGIRNIKDTQCGFKLFTRDSCRLIFSNLHLVRWAFDVEMLYIAQNSGIKVIEVPVNWKEIAGSKLVFLPATISFFRDYFSIIVFYMIRLWKIKK